MFFLRKSTLERLPVVMSGVRMGERVLQIGVDDPALVGAIAAKVGLSGHAAVVVTDEGYAAKARAAAATVGALADVQVTSLDALPFSNASFDVVVLHAGGVKVALSIASGAEMLRDTHRVLRSGGRLVVIDIGDRVGLLGRLGAPRGSDIGETVNALGAAGFRPARLLAEREGYRFIEGLKPQL